MQISILIGRPRLSQKDTFLFLILSEIRVARRGERMIKAEIKGFRNFAKILCQR
jgi:hypothetical protein